MLSRVLSLKQPKTLPEYQFVPGISSVEHSSPSLTQRHFDRPKHIHPGAGRSVDVASSSLKAMHPRCKVLWGGAGPGGEQVRCKGAQWNRAHLRQQLTLGAHTACLPQAGPFLSSVGVKHLMLIGFGGREWDVASPAGFVLWAGTHPRCACLRCGLAPCFNAEPSHSKDSCHPDALCHL